MAESDVSSGKGCFVGDIKDSDKVKGLFLVREMVKAETRAGKPFLTLSLLDRTGEITARVWDNALQLENECKPGNIVFIGAQAQSYRDTLQLKVVSARAQEKETIDWSLFMASTPFNIKEMFSELKKIVATVDEVNIKALLVSFLSDSNFVRLFQDAPAAKNMHHAYIGGLLEHTLAVVKLADNISAAYSSIDRSLLICGAFLHDIGKVREFSFEVPPVDYSDQGRLIGHMVLAIEMIHERLSLLPDFPEGLATRIKHLVLSHHGKHEFGSPSLPMLRESFVLNFIDDLDAKMNYMDKLTEQTEGAGYQWSKYQRMFERFLFVPGKQEQEMMPEILGEGAINEPDAENKRQPTLWG